MSSEIEPIEKTRPVKTLGDGLTGSPSQKLNDIKTEKIYVLEAVKTIMNINLDRNEAPQIK